eukprot:TRINITY_DN11124_c1_g2_i3.p1 TRINITY_DN11124_c1_g2~~TRINITY_DN11124_c1_g2_i3.p1  ORF type:complete len:359 (+),score=71.42 TRINITY_DN11124_c1_g2_i3:41-1078(+)
MAEEAPQTDCVAAQPDVSTPLPDEAQQFFQNARRADITGDPETALESYTDALTYGVATCGEMGLALDELYFYYGACLLKHTIETAARSATLETLAAASEGDEETELDMATACECINCAIKLFQQQPDNKAKQKLLGDAHTELARVLLEAGEADQALGSYESAVAAYEIAEPKSRLTAERLVGRVSGFICIPNTKTAATTSLSAFEDGLRLRNDTTFHTILQQAIFAKVDPCLAMTFSYFQLATCQERRKSYNDAKSSLQKALDILKDNKDEDVKEVVTSLKERIMSLNELTKTTATSTGKRAAKEAEAVTTNGFDAPSSSKPVKDAAALVRRTVTVKPKRAKKKE